MMHVSRWALLVTAAALLLGVTKGESEVEPFAVVSAHPRGINALAFSPDGTLLASAGDDAVISLWDVKRRTRVCSFAGHNMAVTCLVFSPDGRMVMSGSYDGTIRLWDTHKHIEVASLNSTVGNDVVSIACAPDGATLALGHQDKTVRLWNIRTVKETVILRGHTAWVYSMAWSPDGKTLASADHSGGIILWDCALQKQRVSFRSPKKTARVDLVAIGFSADGMTLLSVGGGSGVTLWDATTGRKRATVPDDGGVYSFAMSPDAKHLATGLGSEKIQLWDPVTLHKRGEFGNHKPYTGALAFSPDGKVLASANGGLRFWDNTMPGQIALWDVDTLIAKLK